MKILRYRYNSNLHNVMSHLSNFLSFICTHTFYDCKMCYNRETSLDVFVCTLFDVLYERDHFNIWTLAKLLVSIFFVNSTMSCVFCLQWFCDLTPCFNQFSAPSVSWEVFSHVTFVRQRGSSCVPHRSHLGAVQARSTFDCKTWFVRITWGE